MRLVVDKNYSNSPEAATFLRRKNRIVLTDAFMVETLKGNFALDSIKRAFETLALFPDQVDFMKTTPKLITLRNLENAGLQRRAVDESQSAAFRRFCSLLSTASSLEELKPTFNFDLLSAYSKKFIDDGKTIYQPMILSALPYYKKRYKTDDIARMLHKGEYRSPFFEEFITNTVSMAIQMTKAKGLALPSVMFFPNTYLLRTALANGVLVLRWLLDGGYEDRKPEKIQNDIIDMAYVAYSTYFDGLLSSDKKQMAIRKTVLEVLNVARFGT